MADGTIIIDTRLDTDGAEKGISSLKSGFGKLGDIGATALKATAVAMAAVATGIATLGTMAIKTYADFEQLEGGVQTLFKGSSEAVLQNAQNAFKTAGLSANQYMDTVTSFSASLLQGLGGDTEKAAKIADMAVTDMADNANKMGTSIEMIQNAYQGFAKDNFTMLDNLKLGYGGTAGEMARLINDSGVMGESFKATAENVKDIPFDKMAEAIHQVQTEMGITGTTAIEASETITGSWNSTKAAFSTLLGYLASGNEELINSSLEAVTKSAGDFANNIMKILPNVLNGVINMLQSLITTLLSKIPGIFDKILPVIIQGAEKIVEGILTILPELIPIVLNTLTQLIDSIMTLLPTLLEMGIQVIVQLALGIAQALPTLIPTIIDVLMQMIQIFYDNIPLIIDAGLQLLMRTCKRNNWCNTSFGSSIAEDYRKYGKCTSARNSFNY